MQWHLVRSWSVLIGDVILFAEYFSCASCQRNYQQPCNASSCHFAGYAGIDEKACKGRGCCWFPFVDDSNKGGPLLELPSCFYVNTEHNSYAATDVNETDAGLEVTKMMYVHDVCLGAA